MRRKGAGHRHRSDGPAATIVDIGGPDADGLARYLLSLATPLRVLSPDEVREALLRRARDLFADNGSGRPWLLASGDTGKETSS
ncbi:hypothetical protein [Streptomyces sp. NBC_00704]|uniref:hypothetical protein n=1 Tax=Streptomyces sp. NBC_00704 TaxID=2975809 RepID=UPI003FA7A5CD